MTLTGRSVLVTGGGSGIGLASGLRAAGAGAAVMLTDTDEEALRAARAQAQAVGLSVSTEVLDVTDEAAVDACVRKTADLFGHLDGLVCSAGVTELEWATRLDLHRWNRILAVNLTGAFLTARASAREMVGGRRSGAIVLLGSTLGATGQKRGAAYTASKAGLIGLTKTLALEWARDAVRVNCVAPGATETPLLRASMTDGAVSSYASLNPLGRLGTPEDQAEAICFLLSAKSDWITGQTLHVNGGGVMP